MAKKLKPCGQAVYGSRGEWYCPVHDTADPDEGCPDPKPNPPKKEK